VKSLSWGIEAGDLPGLALLFQEKFTPKFSSYKQQALRRCKTFGYYLKAFRTTSKSCSIWTIW